MNFFVGFSFIIFVLDGNVKTYGLLYLELLDKYDEGTQRTGLPGTVFGVIALTLGILHVGLQCFKVLYHEFIILQN